MFLKIEKINVFLFDLISFQFDLVCDKALYGTISTSLVYIGSIMGAIVIGILSDKLGRKTIIFSAGCAVSLFSLLSAFPNDYWLFVLFRIVVGFGFGMYDYLSTEDNI